MSVSEQLQDVLNRCRFSIDQGLNIISVRGSRVEGGRIVRQGEQTDRFDDTMFLVDFDSGVLEHMPCTAGQPGWYWIRHRSYAGEDSGCPFTRPCQVRYVRGRHKGQPALRQHASELGRLPVIRDLDQDAQLEVTDRYDYPLTTGINIHPSGSTGKVVGPSSSGCHVVQSPWDTQPWRTVIDLTYHRYGSQPSFLYSVVESEWLEDEHTRVLYGSRGDVVTKLQGYLRARGYDPGNADRWMQQKTDTALRKLQVAVGAEPNGIAVNFAGDSPVADAPPVDTGKLEALKKWYGDEVHEHMKALYVAFGECPDPEVQKALLIDLNRLNGVLIEARAK